MKRKILCFILAMLMIIPMLPLSVMAAAIAEVIDDISLPVVSVSGLHSYDEGIANQFRALPDDEGNFYLDISLNKAPADGSEVVVYYRTVDDSAVAKWGDYENAEIGAFVTLNKANGYKARVTIGSKILENGFYTDDEKGEPNKDKIVSRRFLFELTSVEGKAELHKPKSESERDQSKVYCYLGAGLYLYQQNDASVYSPLSQELHNQIDSFLKEVEKENGGKDGIYPQLAELCDAFLKSYKSIIKYDSLYKTVGGASALSTPPLQYGKQTSHSDKINMNFDEEWRSYIQSGWCDLGISIDGTVTREYWDSDGEATFNLYYNYGGEKKLALTLYLEGEFDDSTHFGWEHAFEYAIEGMESGHRKDHMKDNFIGFTVYDNDGKEAYTVKKDDGVSDVCNQLNRTLVAGNAVIQAYSKERDLQETAHDVILGELGYSYYLRMPSNFALADGYSFEFISHSTYKKEIRWLEDVKLYFTLISNKAPMIAKDDMGNQMVTTNLETMKEGDPLRMSVRFDRPVHIADPEGKCYITADIYNDKGSLLAKGVKFKVKQLDGTTKNGKYYHYAWDTLVFEAVLTEEQRNGLDGKRIASLRNISIIDGTEDEKNPTNGIRSFFTELDLLGKSIRDIYVSRDFRTPVATVSQTSTESWAKSKSLDVYVNTESGSRFNDYVTVYYQWSNSTETPETYSSKVVFHTKQDGEVLKTIIGTGSGNTYLHLKAVSAYGKSSVSGPFGPFKFDNSAPELKAEQIQQNDNLKDRTISVPLPDDKGGSGLRDISLYYIKKNGEETLLKYFTEADFSDDTKTLTYTISHKDVGIGIDIDGNPVFERGEVTFYWVITDKLGNSSGKTAEFSMIFDTNDYISGEIESVGPVNISGGVNSANFESASNKLDDLIYIYNYRLNNGKEFEPYITFPEKNVYYAFLFQLKSDAFVNSEGEDAGVYSANIYYKGEKLNSDSYALIEDGEGTGNYVVLIFSEIESGRYDFQFVRTEGESVRVSRTYSVYATNDEKDNTAIKNKIEFGTLLSNNVYQLSADYSYFYYKDEHGVINKVYYNGTKQPPTFSTLAKAKEYVYYKELSDIYLVKLNSSTASALISGTTGYLIADGETAVPKEGDYWIRYKSEAWTPTSGESAWVYYYYGTSDVLSEGALSSNLQSALNAVANRIVSHGKTVILTDSSLFLGSAMGDKMLDEYGMPYLVPGQIHTEDELSKETMCGNVWSIEVGFAADKNIYKSKVSVGVEGTGDYAEYPIVGNFALPEDSIFQYMTYDQYKGGASTWIMLDVKKGQSFINLFKASGVYYIREISIDGVSVYAIYIDKEAPKVSFSNTDENGDFKEIPVDGIEILDIRTKNLYIGSIAPNEYDRLSYVSVYKVSNLSLVSVYTADELASAPIKLEDGKYYIVVADRSGNHYTVTANVSSTELECSIKESVDKFIKLTCNRRNDQIQRYEVYLNGELVTSTYAEEQTFSKAGFYKIYIQDIYGNEFSKEHLFVRNYPTVTWKYYGEDGKYHVYDPENTSATGFILTWVSDNQYKISTSVKTRFSFNGDYEYEFVGAKPEYSESLGTETIVTIEAGQSFTLKVYYKNHKDCYAVYSGVVDVIPPSINVSAEVDVLRNGEYGLFDEWAKGEVDDVITMKDLYYVLEEITRKNVINGDTVTSDIIKITANDANDISLIEVYLNGELIKKQDANTGFGQIIVNKWGKYRIVAKDGLGNVSEFNFTNGMPDYFDYFVDGVKKEQELHSYLNFVETADGKHVYTKLDYGKAEFKLNIKQNADVFMSVGVSGGDTEILGFSIADGKIYPLTYKIVLDKNNNKAVELEAGEAILDISSKDFKTGKEYLISSDGAYAVYASVGTDKTVSIKVYAPEDSSKVVSVGARVEVVGSNTTFVCAELSKKSSNVSFEGLGIQTNTDIHANNGFIVDEDMFESERILSVSLYYSKLNNLDASNLKGKTNIYMTDREYGDEGFYLLIVRNYYGNEKVYRIAISKSFGVTASVTFSDGHKIFYSKDHGGKLYSNSAITFDILDEGVTLNATLNGSAYTGFTQIKDGNITYITFSAEGTYNVKFTDAYGNVITRQFEIDKSTYTVSDDLLTGYNDKALKRDEGYTNQKLSVNKTVYDNAGIYYLAVQYGETLNVLFDAFSESAVETTAEDMVDVIGTYGDGVYTVICRNRYGAVVTKDIHYRETPTLKLERTTRSKSESEIYDLNYAITLGFWSNNTLSFSTDAKIYEFAVNGNAAECPKTLVFENAGDFGSFEYDITYIDEYGFEYSFKAYLVRRNVTVEIPSDVHTTEIDGLLNTKNDISITFGENIYATYTRNNGEEVIYHSGDVLKKDGTYRFTVIDYAGNATTTTIKKDTAVEFSITESAGGNEVQNGSVINSSKISFKSLNKDSAYIEKIIHNGVVQTELNGKDGKWELIVCDKLGNRSHFSFYIVTRSQNGFAYTTPYEYRITEMWYDSGDGVKVSYMTFVEHSDSVSSFNFTENGKYTAVMTSNVTGVTYTFEFTVNTNSPEVSLVGCNNGETTINDVTFTGYKVGDIIAIYRETKTGEELVDRVEITSLATKVPTITEGGKYRIVVESEAGVQTELSLVRKHVMNTAGSIFIMVIIGVSVIGLFTGLVYRNKSKTDE